MTALFGETCSALSALDEPLPGTATRTLGWLCVEHPGAWGRDVVKDSVLGAELTAELDRRTAAAGVRLMLIRRPGRVNRTERRTVLLANSRPEASWCEHVEIANLADLLDIDLQLLMGSAPGIGSAATEPDVLVCAHGQRDQCCARLGRPIAAHLSAEFPDSVWQCSHTGGHRFAPSMILLPTGYTYGRLDGAQSVAAVEAARRGEVSTLGLRGRTSYSPRGQAAEIAVREQTAAGLHDLTVLETGGSVVVSHGDGRRWEVELSTTMLAPRPASCGAVAKPIESVRVEKVSAQR